MQAELMGASKNKLGYRIFVWDDESHLSLFYFNRAISKERTRLAPPAHRKNDAVNCIVKADEHLVSVSLERELKVSSWKMGENVKKYDISNIVGEAILCAISPLPGLLLLGCKDSNIY